MKNYTIKSVMTILLIVVGYSAGAYPLYPVPLRKLIIGSEYIVYADVIKVSNPEIGNYRDESSATLLIRDRLKGSIAGDTIRVAFETGMICPAPASYLEGTQVLAFLDYHHGSYRTHALSYGSKVVSDESYKVYKNRINEMHEILEMRDVSDRNSATVDWLVRCAVHPATRWEGAYELLSQNDLWWTTDNKESVDMINMAPDNDQIARLREAVLAIDIFADTDLMLLDIVSEQGTTAITQLLKDRLKSSSYEDIFVGKGMMSRITKYTRREDLRLILDEINNVSMMDKEWEEKSGHLFRKFIETL